MPDTENSCDTAIPARLPLTYKSKKNVLAWLALASLLSIIAFASLFWFFGELEDSVAHRKHTYQIINDAEQFLSAMKDAETGQRGYLLTGDEVFLQPYLLVRDNVKNRVLALQQQTRIDAAQQHLGALLPLVDAKLAQLENSIVLRRNHNTDALIADIRSGHGKDLMDNIRTEIRAFIQIENDVAQLNETLLQDNMHRLLTLFISSCILIGLIILAFAYMTYRHSVMKMTNLVLLDIKNLLDVEENANRQLKLVNAALQISQDKLAVTLYSIGDGVIVTDDKGCVTLLNSVAEKLTGWMLAEAEGLPIEDIFRIVGKASHEAVKIPVLETLAHGTIQGLANHTVLISRNGNELDIADSCAPIHNSDNIVIGAVLVFRDVTREYAIQQALRDSTTQIETVLNTVGDGIITFHADTGLIATINPAIVRMFGYSTAEITGKHFSCLIPGFNEGQINAGVSTSNSGSNLPGITYASCEMTGNHKNGNTFPLELTISEMWLNKKKYYTVIIHDITSRKRAEAKLVQTSALQRAIFNSENFSSIATDEKGVIQIFNVGAEKMLGYTADEVMNRVTPADLSDPQELVERAKSLSAELATVIQPGFEALVFKASRGIADIYELTYIRKDGSRLQALVSVTALRNQHDAIIGYLLIGTDNTAHKKADEEARLANAKLTAWGQALNLFAIVAETDIHGKIIYANDPFCQISQYTREELIGKNHREVVNSGHHTKAFWQEMWSTISRGEIWKGEIMNRAKDGTAYWVDTVIVPQLNAIGKPETYLSFRFLITQRKQLDQMLRETNMQLINAKSVAEKANLAKSDFLSSMSHELRTPLSAILGFAQLMQSGSPAPTATQKRNIEQILQAGWYLLELINEILDLALIESGKLSLSMEPMSLSDVMQECQTLIEPQSQKYHIHIAFPPTPIPYFIKADRIRIKQIVINLLSNAIKYNRPDGSVVVNCIEHTPGRLRISVADTGEGLAPEKIVQLFQPFNRLGQECNTIEGTGIGLVMSKRLIELMGGEIGLESTPGKGSVFWIEMSLTSERKHFSNNDLPEKEYELPRSATAANSKTLYTLLYIEDNPANLMLVEDLIARRADMRLLTASDGFSGIDIARITLPDIILMDINLPGISGIEAMAILSNDEATSHIPIVALSANAMPNDIEKGLQAGFFRYLTKPIKIDEFMHTLNLALASSAAAISISENRDDTHD